MKVEPFPQDKTPYNSRERCDYPVSYRANMKVGWQKCQHHAKWKIDGKPFCNLHAGYKALKFMEMWNEKHG